MERMVIGVAGRNGAGKTGFIKAFKDIVTQPFVVVESGKILAATLAPWRVVPGRNDYALVFDAIEKMVLGEGALVRALRQYVDEAPPGIVIVDALRMHRDATFVRSYPTNKIVYIDASFETRCKRMLARGEKAGESQMTPEQFLRQEQAANEVGIPEIGKNADFPIDNEGDFKSLLAQVKQFAKKHLGMT